MLCGKKGRLFLAERRACSESANTCSDYTRPNCRVRRRYVLLANAPATDTPVPPDRESCSLRST